MENSKNIEMNIKKKKYKILLVIAIIILILLFILLTLKDKEGKNNDNDNDVNNNNNVSYIDTLSAEEKSMILGNSNNSENVYFDKNGIKINASENLKKEFKISSEIIIDDIFLYAEAGKSVIYFNVNNTSNLDMSNVNIKVTLFDNDSNNIYSFSNNVESLKANSKQIVEHIVEQDISNAYDIEISLNN